MTWFCSICGNKNTFTRKVCVLLFVLYFAWFLYVCFQNRIELSCDVVDDSDIMYDIPYEDSLNETNHHRRPLVHVFLIQESMCLDAMQAVSHSFLCLMRINYFFRPLRVFYTVWMKCIVKVVSLYWHFPGGLGFFGAPLFFLTLISILFFTYSSVWKCRFNEENSMVDYVLCEEETKDELVELFPTVTISQVLSFSSSMQCLHECKYVFIERYSFKEKLNLIISNMVDLEME